MIINDNGNIQQYLSSASHQLSPSAFLTAAQRATEWTNLSSQISSVSHLLFTNVRYALKRHMVTLPIHNHYLGAFGNGEKKGGREEKRNKDTEKCKTGGENWQCGSISDSPLPLSYQSHWLVHVILLWFGLANQWTADRLPVTVQPLKWRWKSHSFIHFTPVRAFFYTSKNLLFLHSHSKRCFSSHCSHWLSGYKRWCKIIQETVDEFLKWRCHILQILVSFISEQLLLSKYWHFSHIHKVPSLIECIIS